MANLAHQNMQSSASQLKMMLRMWASICWSSCCKPKVYLKPNISVGAFKPIARADKIALNVYAMILEGIDS